MKKILMTMAAVSALAAAAPAAAQYANSNFDVRINELRTDLQAGVQSGRITRNEAVQLRAQLQQLSQLERQFSRDGLSRFERDQLQQRIQTLRQQIRMADRNGDTRPGYGDNGNGYGRDCPPGLEKRNNGCLPPGQVGRGDRDGRWDDDNRSGRTQWMDRNRDGFDDRDLNRDRRIDDREWRMADGRYGDNDRYDRDDDRYDRDYDRDYDRRDGRYDRDYDRSDGRYDNRDTRRGGIGGIIESVLGGGGLRVGQRVSGNLGAVPYQYRNQFRDGNGVYYRADSRSIYQIDARTDTVVRIYSINR